MELRLLSFDGLQNRVAQIHGALAASSPMIGNDAFGFLFRTECLQCRRLSSRVGAEAVDAYHDGEPVLPNVFDVPAEIGKTLLHRSNVFFPDIGSEATPMPLQC